MLRNQPATFLLAARAVRDIGNGFVSVLLPIYLLALGFTPLEVGVIATASLLGSALLTICVGFLGARYDHRQILLADASLMIATGVAFAVVHEYALLLVIAFVGTIYPSAAASAYSCRWSTPCSRAKSRRESEPGCSRVTALWGVRGCRWWTGCSCT
ncbi:MFS transporter [Sinorhizobium medicae]